MSKSFEDKWKDRLGEYKAPVPENLRQQVLGAVAPRNYWSPVYQTVGAALIFLSLFQIGKVSNTDTASIASPNIAEVPQISETASVPPRVEQKTQSLEGMEQKEIFSKKENKRRINTISPVEETTLPPSRYAHIATPHPESQTTNGLVFAESAQRGVVFPEWKKEVTPIVPQKVTSLNPYFNVGAHFLYHRVFPNLADELIIENYQSPGSMASSRIGFSGEAGVQRPIGQRWLLRGGLAANFIQQQYHFHIRGLQPSALVPLETGYLEPQFAHDTIQIRSHVLWAGAKAQLQWSPFPQPTDALFVSMEYQRRIGPGAQFSYSGERHQLLDSYQILGELGWHKTLLIFPKGHLAAMPGIRYAFGRSAPDQPLTVKPFSAGITLTYSMK